MKSIGGVKDENGVSSKPSEEVKAEPEKIDFSNVKIEPLFEEEVDFDTFSKSDFRAVKVKECVAVPKSKKLLQFTLDDGTGTESNESNISTADLYEADEQAETKKLTEDQINTVVGMYQQYLNQWSANANVLGVQNPFFLDFNDDTDGLGILGQMLALDGKSVKDVRDGKVSYDDLTLSLIHI